MNEKRLQKVIANMKAEGLSQIIVSATASLYYLAGIWAEPMERMLALYIRDDGTVILFANEIFGIQPINGIQIVTHKDSDNPLESVAKAVNKGEIGIDKFWAAKFVIELMQLRADVTPRHGSSPVDRARMIKDEQEIELIRHASLINDKVVTMAIAALKDGVTEIEIAEYVEKLFAENGANRYGDGQLACFGANGADPHHGPDDTVIKAGDSVVLDIFKPINRYWCDMTRTVFYKTASEEQQKVYELVKNANLAAEAIIKPGLPMSSFDAAARKVIADAGYGEYFTHRLGHGAGLECHEPPDNSSACEEIAVLGMVFSVEPGIYLPGKFGVRVEDLVLVTETGCEVLNKAPKDFCIVE